ncbi:hypothetical protein FA13DRAFT_1730383 [Coprinellus micaceus]|uniref:Uncharacterized protein n=1 Tax=Coprinellus micaceus TaxID=71717 RepID=A0A4Y7TGT0_COPMI|nr:hypothetical protein FA13DRAFT_1730383 [Coprinellus micaceus]
MLCRAKLVARLCNRRYSTVVNPYSNFQKLRAYPFAFDQETAKSFLGLWGSALCNKGLFASTLARFIPGFRGNVFQPKRIVPVYFPAWIYDAELQADIDFNDTNRTALFQIQTGYLPGSDFRILSTTPLRDPDTDATLTLGQIPKLSSNKTLPWSTGLIHQQGQEVSCLPYSIFPLTGLKALSHENTEIFPRLHCDLDTVREKFSVFRPLLIPLYLAEYEADALDGEKRSCTVFMDAISTSGSVYAYRNPQSFRDEYDTGLDDLAKTGGFQSPHDPDFFSFDSKDSYVGSGAVSISPPRDITAALLVWLHWRLRDANTIERLAKASVVEEGDSDSRIREYDPEERAVVQVWMDTGAEVMMTKRILERIQEQIPQVTADPDAPNHLRAPIEALEANIKKLEERRVELQPEWWTEYLARKEERN